MSKLIVQTFRCKFPQIFNVRSLRQPFRPGSVNGGKRPLSSSSKQSCPIPGLVYVHNPFKFVQNKLQFLRMKLFWDKRFNESEFIRGSKMAAITITDIVRNQEALEIGKLTTPSGFHQITRDMLLSRHDPRLQLTNIRDQDIQRAIPLRVMPKFKRGRKRVAVDMLFVALRNLKDFELEDAHKVQLLLRKFDELENSDREAMTAAHRILFAEILIRFYRDYTPKFPDDWSISFYRIISFNILNYNPIY